MAPSSIVHPLHELSPVERWLVMSHMETGGITFGTLRRLIWEQFQPPEGTDTRSPSELWLLAVRKFFSSQLEHREAIENRIALEIAFPLLDSFR